MTVTFTMYVPPAIGVPLIIPDVVSIVKVLGNPVALHDIGTFAPRAFIGTLYVVPSKPSGSAAVMIARPWMTRFTLAVAVAGVASESLTFRLTLNVPTAMGVPLI